MAERICEVLLILLLFMLGYTIGKMTEENKRQRTIILHGSRYIARLGDLIVCENDDERIRIMEELACNDINAEFNYDYPFALIIDGFCDKPKGVKANVKRYLGKL